MRRIALVVAGAVAAVVAFAAPASAHDDLCEAWGFPGGSCDPILMFTGTYVNYDAHWCELPGGWIDMEELLVVAKRDGWYELVIFRNNPTNQVVWKSITYSMQAGDVRHIPVTGFPKKPKGYDLYMRLEMDPFVGVTTYWRNSPLHMNPPHEPYNDVTDFFPQDRGANDCSS
jgi:hypothetical protein